MSEAGHHDVQDTGFYDTTYSAAEEDLQATIRREAFGEDIGQFSWLTADEYRRFFSWLDLDASSRVLDVASGSGGPTLFMARTLGCTVTGIDIHEEGVARGNRAADRESLGERVRFLCSDARQPLAFPDESFDAVVCIDSINHIYEREALFREWLRILRPGGRAMFTDPITVTGMLRRQEIIVRSGSMGEFVFTPPGVDGDLLRAGGFEGVEVEDVTENMALVAERWHAARVRYRAELDRIEGAEENSRFQTFLEVVGSLARERRLSRFAYLARRPALGSSP